ncbi:MAG: hypothetical protein LBF42_01875, partial [Puniceicoccales bacterium]|nr:hypothetical protein [Puniceicoccales bacterium]
LGKKDPLSQRIWQAIQTFFSKLSAQIRLDDTKSADFALLDELMDAIEKQDVDGFKAVFDIFETRYPGTKEQLKNHVKFLLGDVTQSETSSVATALRELLEISKGET